MPRFFMSGSNIISNGVAVFRGSDLNHIKVLRIKLGERLIICDGEGRDYECRLSRLGDNIAEAELIEERLSAGEPTINTTVLVSLPKGDRADFIAQKCTEAGAHEIVYFFSEHSVSRPDAKSLAKKVERWSRIAGEAAKQSGRGIIPKVRSASSLAEALDIGVKADLKLFMYETGDRIPLSAAIGSAADAKSAAIITGPEGGFEKYEADIARVSGFTICSMGPRIFRCETAPLAALTALMYATGNMD